jgi:hypothetical protein
MRNPPVFTRPTFDQALRAWEGVLKERGVPTDCLWLFEENLCFEATGGSGGPTQAFQTTFTPPPPKAERVAYRYFSQFERPVVFYRIGSWEGKSLALILCDSWFEAQLNNPDYVKREDWFISFYPGQDRQVDEVQDLERYQARLVRNRPVQALDFCMTLRAVHEMLAHGHVLSPYEHYALRFLNAWKQFLPHKNRLDN